MFLVFLLIASIFILFLFYLRKCQKFWKNRGFPSTSPNLLFGDITNSVFGRKQIGFVVQDIYKAFPNERVVGFYEFNKPNLLIRDPRLIESVLVKDFSSFTDRIWIDSNGNNRLTKHLFMLRGKQWKDLRTKLITPFSTNKLKLMLSLMDGCAQIMDSLLREKCEEEMIDIRETVSRFATDVIGCCVFGLQFNTLKEPESEYRKIGKIIFAPKLKLFIISFLRIISPKVVALLRLSEMSPEIEKFFSNLLVKSEEFRKKESFRRNDLLQLILDIRDRDRERALCEEKCDDAMVDDDIVLSTVFIFYAAGFETTATTLSFCLYELALHPEYQQKLREEVQTVLQTSENTDFYKILKKLTYAEMVISETLRKYSPVGVLNRVCTVPYQIPESSLQLMPGERLTIPVHSLHYDETYFPNPDKFDPERFTTENIATRPHFTYMPFGDGPRMCLAMRFAKMEMKLCLSRIISKYEFSPCDKTVIPIRINPRGFLLSPTTGIQLRVRCLTQD